MFQTPPTPQERVALKKGIVPRPACSPAPRAAAVSIAASRPATESSTARGSATASTAADPAPGRTATEATASTAA